jgi:alkanesulfonate monooxygenase SsuD/methylene tetrahydromethanopterin reductase-like flavin-dependent oxidoreductase (luciferase family)
MMFDIFFSICQTEVDGYMPSEKVMWQNFFDQVKLADTLGYETAWVAETHLSCQTQKQNSQPVIPHFKGEIGLNTDILQLAHKIFGMTKKINVGSAIRNILCNGGPLAHAEAVRTFLALHSLDSAEKRLLNIGFAAGRFPFSNTPYGIVPRNKTEEAAWSVVKGKIFLEATEIFIRALKGEALASSDIAATKMNARDFRTPADWQKVVDVYRDENKISKNVDEIVLIPRWKFEKVGLIPQEVSLDLLRLVIGSHDPEAQVLANKYWPCGVFNLSITPSDVVNETHERMKKNFHASGGEWQRHNMPRTVLVYFTESEARRAHENYWRAMEGTLDQKKIDTAVDNTLWGSPETIVQKLKEKYHHDDRLMLWFDFNNHNNDEVKNNMRTFAEKVMPALK